ncbi:CHAD domain-containing protein [Lacibacterium aquatile]|uniref:CHAD domain-containing protein n=1 Tax=Lacibacterium aquatile TaxID=1168082 RepID=A0ABW5DRG6_9PROT
MAIAFDLDPAAAARVRRQLGLGSERLTKLFVLDTPGLEHRAAPLLSAEDPGQGLLTAVIAITLSQSERPDGVRLERSSLIAGGQTAERLTLFVPRSQAIPMRSNLADAEPVPVLAIDDVAVGYRLLAKESWHPRKAMPLEVSPDLPLNRFVACLLRNVREHLVAQLLPLVREGRIEAIHQARVSLRRLRAGLALIGRLVDAGQSDAVREKARLLAGIMGRTRDWDVFLTETLPDAQGAIPGESGWPYLKDYGTLQRRAEWTLLARTVGGPMMLELVLALDGWADHLDRGLPDTRRIGEVLPQLIDKRWRRVKARGRKFDELPVVERHNLRIEIKKLRYLVDFSKSILSKSSVEDWRPVLSDLQDGLGRLNDGATARMLLQGALQGLNHDGAYGAGLLVGWLEARAMGLQPPLGAHWQRLKSLKSPAR